MNKRPDVVLIAGPTASGKSELALSKAEFYDGEIINADSMQVYDKLSVLTARPSAADLERVPHHLYGYVDVSRSLSVSKWLLDVEPVLLDLKSRDKVPVFVGGTGLYFRSLLEGIATVPEISDAIRREVRQQLSDEGSEALYGKLARIDPTSAKTLHPSDGHRIARAMEVFLSSGKSLRSHQSTHSPSLLVSYQNLEKLLLLPDRAELHERIHQRTDKMFKIGALEEVLNLTQHEIAAEGGISKAIGVQIIKNYHNGELTIKECIDKVKAATRQYSKRQNTWFRNQFDESWTRIHSV